MLIMILFIEKAVYKKSDNRVIRKRVNKEVTLRIIIGTIIAIGILWLGINENILEDLIYFLQGNDFQTIKQLLQFIIRFYNMYRRKIKRKHLNKY